MWIGNTHNLWSICHNIHILTWHALWPHPCYMLIAKSLKHYFCEILQYSRKLSQEKTFANWWKVRFFAEKTFTDHSLVPPNKAMPPNFTDKTFANGHKPRNSQKFSPSKVSNYSVSTMPGQCGHSKLLKKMAEQILMPATYTVVWLWVCKLEIYPKYYRTQSMSRRQSSEATGYKLCNAKHAVKYTDLMHMCNYMYIP